VQRGLEQRLVYSVSQSTGEDTSRSRSFARKKLDSAVMMFERSRIEPKLRRRSARSFPARSAPISSTPAK
jgi:hypothetical protein